jgi:drug/metabolite transporter (DMT)-like permease
VCVIWGTTYLAIRVAIEAIPPLLMTGVRWVTAGTLLLTILRLAGERLPARRDWGLLAVLGVLFIGFGNGAVVLAEQVVPSGLTSVLVAVTPFWMIGIERLISRAEPVTKRQAAGLLLGFAGVVFLVWPELEAGRDWRFMWGVVATQLACLGWSIGSNISHTRKTEGSLLAATALQMIFGGAVILLLAAITGEVVQQPITERSAAAFFYLIVIGSLVGFSAYAYALRHLPLSLVSLYAYINPIIAVALGTLLLAEPMTPRLLAATAVVLVGVAIVKR